MGELIGKINRCLITVARKVKGKSEKKRIYRTGRATEIQKKRREYLG